MGNVFLIFFEILTLNQNFLNNETDFKLNTHCNLFILTDLLFFKTLCLNTVA